MTFLYCWQEIICNQNFKNTLLIILEEPAIHDFGQVFIFRELWREVLTKILLASEIRQMAQKKLLNLSTYHYFVILDIPLLSHVLRKNSSNSYKW